MDLRTFLDTPPWEWPTTAGQTFRKILIDRGADESERLIAAELAGDFTVIDDDLADVLLAIVRSPDEPGQLRAKAAISLGPVLESADTDGFDDPDDVPISESTFRNIQESLHKVYVDHATPKEVSRRVLEAAVRAPADWHKDAIREAYASGDEEKMLTAIFSMRWVRGFDDQILESLKSANPEIHVEAVYAAGNRELEAAWPHIAALVADPGTPKPLLLAAIDAIGSIRPREAAQTLAVLADSDDEEIAAAADEAISSAEGMSGEDDDEDDEENVGEWIN